MVSLASLTNLVRRIKKIRKINERKEVFLSSFLHIFLQLIVKVFHFHLILFSVAVERAFQHKHNYFQNFPEKKLQVKIDQNRRRRP